MTSTAPPSPPSIPVPYPHPPVAREGWPFLGLAVGVALVASGWFGLWGALPFWLIALFVLQFFRDPPRSAPQGEHLVLAPADGRVIVVGRMQDPWTGRDALKISIFMNVFNVHSNRAPVDGTVESVTYVPGAFVNADLDKASEANERNAVRIRTRSGLQLTCVQVAGLIARRILCHVGSGDVLSRGQRYGFIRFGSRVDLYLPPDARPLVTIGERVQATATAVADCAACQPPGAV